jgi:hypothetical protein
VPASRRSSTADGMGGHRRLAGQTASTRYAIVGDVLAELIQNSRTPTARRTS